MSYRTKIIFVEVIDKDKNAHARKESKYLPMVFAEYDLGKLGSASNITEVFFHRINYKLVLDDGHEVLKLGNKDVYGNHLKSADLGMLLNTLVQEEKREHNRLLPPLIAMVKALIEEQEEWEIDSWSTIDAVLYNY